MEQITFNTLPRTEQWHEVLEHASARREKGNRMMMCRLLLVTAVGLGMAGWASTGFAAGDESRGKETAKTVPAPRQTLIRLGFGPRQEWLESNEAIQALGKCKSSSSKQPSTQCVQNVMTRHGASTDAFEFYRLTGWFMQDIKDTGGVVRIAQVARPWRANENVQPALVGGSPIVVYPEEENLSATVEQDAAFKLLKATYPDLWFWGSSPAPEGNEATKEGQRFVFRYRLLDGCHACPIRGWARVQFDFQTDGLFQGAKLLNIVSQQ